MIIETKEDIELLVYLIKEVNLQTEESDDEKNIADTLLNIEHELKLKSDSIVELTQRIQRLERIPQKNSKKSNVPHSEKCIRQYSITQYKNLPKIKELNKDGTLIGGRNSKLNYTIQDLQKIRSLISDIDLSFNKLAEKINVSTYTIRILCYGVEIGYFDKWFKEWEQMEANKFYNKNSSIKTVNNPQKRKEMIGMG